MSVYEFIKLSLNSRARLASYGIFLTSREVNSQHILLYSLNDFFVEVTYDPAINAITMISPFKSVIQLEPYLDQINITDLI